MALTQISTQGIKDGTIFGSDLADQSVTLAKLPHGTSLMMVSFYELIMVQILRLKLYRQLVVAQELTLMTT